ncbi:MAG: dihydrodipicolinate synthase family protein [Christensenellales bacterium]
MNKKLMGVFAPITTPFQEGGSVDYDGLKKNMEVYASSKLNGYLALGSNGENKSLTNDEKANVLEVIIRHKGAQQTVMAGCIFESTMETIEFAKVCEGLGADFITLLAPSYFKKQMTDDVLYRYFTDVADSVSVPCLVYNAPQFCAGTVLSVNLIRRLAQTANIVGVKDSSDMGNMDGYLMAVKNKFNVMAGSANFFLDSLIRGAAGGIISLANAFPEVTCRLYELFSAKDYENMFAYNEKILYFNKQVSGKGGVAAVKYAMDLAGLAGGDPRLPLFPLAQGDRDMLESVLKTEGLI